jgi:hypothetical protein
MTSDPLPLANRVRKARRASTLGCGHYVNVGAVIVRRSGRWTCLDCALAIIRAATRNVPAADQPGAAPPTERNRT